MNRDKQECADVEVIQFEEATLPTGAWLVPGIGYASYKWSGQDNVDYGYNKTAIITCPVCGESYDYRETELDYKKICRLLKQLKPKTENIKINCNGFKESAEKGIKFAKSCSKNKEEIKKLKLKDKKPDNMEIKYSELKLDQDVCDILCPYTREYQYFAYCLFDCKYGYGFDKEKKAIKCTYEF
jgi:hypothetical protein